MILPEDEIQAAHDRLTAIVLGEVPWPYETEEIRDSLVSALDVLCWVLCHKHNASFEGNLASIDEWMKARGLILRARVG